MNMERKSSKSRSKLNTITTAFLISLSIIFLLGIISYIPTKEAYAQDSSQSVADLHSVIHNTLNPTQRAYGPKLLTVKKGEDIYKIFTVKTDIREIFEDNMISVEKGEIVNMSTPYIVDGTIIRIISTEVITEINRYDIPFKTETVKTPDLPLGEKEVIQEGVLGVRVKNIINYFEDGVLVKTTLIEDKVVREPVKEIVQEGTSTYTLDGIVVRGYNCPYWNSVVDAGPYSDEEKSWLKFVMYCESGCNAEHTKGFYKGLFQWSPNIWKAQFSENIYDGDAQIKHTVEKIRAGAATMWPACNRKYISTR